MNTKFIAIIGAIAVILAAAGLMLSSKRDQKKQTVDAVRQISTREAFFPGLSSKLEDVAKIELIGPKEKVTVEKKDNQWTVVESDGYAAREDSIGNLLNDFGNVKKLEAKTSTASLYPRIGVEDSPAEDSESKTIKLYGKGGAEFAALIVGKDDYTSAEEGQGPNKFVRKPGDKQSWLAAGNIRAYVTKANWVKSDFLDIPATRIQSTEILHKDGERVLIAKADEKLPVYELKTKPEGREVKDPGSIAEGSRVLSGLRFDDVKKRATLNLNDADSSATATIRTFDGLVFKAAVHHSGDKDYIVLDVSADDAAIAAANDARKAKYEADKAVAAAQTPAPTPAPVEGQPAPTAAPSPTPVPEPTLIEADKIRKEAEELNAKLSPWAFAVPAYYRDRLMRRNEYFLKELKPEGEAATPPSPGESKGLPNLEGMDIQQLMQQQGMK